MHSRSLLLLLLFLLLLLLLLMLRLQLCQRCTLFPNFSLHHLEGIMRGSSNRGSFPSQHTTGPTFSFFATAVRLLVMECSSRSSLIMGSAGTLSAETEDPFLAGKNKKLGGGGGSFLDFLCV
jgi:hypothetical protein